jgi:hypothetical protein
MGTAIDRDGASRQAAVVSFNLRHMALCICPDRAACLGIMKLGTPAGQGSWWLAGIMLENNRLAFVYRLCIDDGLVNNARLRPVLRVLLGWPLDVRLSLPLRGLRRFCRRGLRRRGGRSGRLARRSRHQRSAQNHGEDDARRKYLLNALSQFHDCLHRNRCPYFH